MMNVVSIGLSSLKTYKCANQVVFQCQAVILHLVFGAEARTLQSVFPLCL